MLSLISWIVFGLIAGIVAKQIMPGEENLGLLKTSALGIIGSVVGGFIADNFLGLGQVGKWNIYSFIVSVLGALLVLFIYAKYQEKK